MEKEQAKAIVKDKLEEYLEAQGINTRKPFRCLNPNHADQNPSMSYDKKNKRVKCFSCNATYDIFDLIGLDYGLSDNREIFKKAYELYGITIDTDNRALDWNDTIGQPKETYTHTANSTQQANFIDYYKQCAEKLKATNYLEERGISAATAKQYMLGYEPHFTQGTGGQVWQAIIIPTGANSYVARNVDKQAEKKNRIRKKGSSTIFNSKVIFTTDKPLIIVEGELDALSVIEAGGQAIGLGSTSNYTQLIRLLEDKDKKPKAPLIIALDNDPEGKEAANRNGAQLVLLIENCGSREELRDYVLKDYEKAMCKNLKTKDIGKPVYERLKAWQTANRYNFRIEYCADPKQNSAAMILEEFYYWYHNYKKLIAPRR